MNKEKLTCRCRENFAVKLGGAQNRSNVSPEGSTYMPSDDSADALFALLTEQEQQAILDSIKSLLSARQSTSVPPASTGS